ncbi:fatty acid cis/trans isomerase [Paraglaciecola sp.]|uniref:fatty acid cis/trans isomerase n=1 Tax=Paraglaciecola sp. TaxID=1920173 RepID=UPI0030F3CFE0
MLLSKKGLWASLGLILICSGCAVIANMNINGLFGEASTKNRALASVSTDVARNKEYYQHVEPIIEGRCVVCHACYDSPCQLKMSSAEGIERGANKERVYHGTRIFAADPNRLFLDAFGSEQWRERGFYPVLNERQQSPQANTQASVLARMLSLKQQHPLPQQKILDDSFDFSLDREQQCPTIEEFDRYAATQPKAGMPYGLPGLNNDEHNTLMNWLEQGAHLPQAPDLSQAQLKAVAQLEQFLNADDLKMQLSARYIYEHLFTSHLYFSELNQDGIPAQFFSLRRSSTPPGEAIKVIASRRPFDDPKIKRVYYRLQPVTSTIVNKTHQPYVIDQDLLDKWQNWFSDAPYTVNKLPSYQSDVAANPLTAFAQLPVNARYRFMLERAQNTIMGYIKGPVCRGQVALNVINDHFWVYFVDPDLVNSPKVEAFYLSQRDNLRLPAEQESTALAVSWLKYASHQSQYLKARSRFLNEEFKDGQHLTLQGIWDGDGHNDNASLTVFRHFDNASVVKGLVGEPPKTAWVIDYALLERIHYLLVAGFDVYGNYGHQLLTRMYMDFLRMEGESNFVALLPSDVRRQAFKAWYQKASSELTQFIENDINIFSQPSGISYQTKHPQAELYKLVKQHLSQVQPHAYRLQDSELNNHSITLLGELAKIAGLSAAILPEITMLMVESDKGKKSEIFTLIRNSAHYNVSSLFDEEDNRDPAHDNVTLVHGLLGSYPNIFWRVNESDLPKLVAQAQQLKTEADYEALLDNFAVRRTAADFWQFSDKLNHTFRQHNPIESGWLDYNRLDNR